MFIHLLCPGICAVLVARQTGAASTSRRGVHRWAGQTPSPHGLWFPKTDMALTSSSTLMPTVAVAILEGGGRWDRRLAYQIFICLLCSVQILWTGKMHYVWISAKAASDRGNDPFLEGQQICFVFMKRVAKSLYGKFQTATFLEFRSCECKVMYNIWTLYSVFFSIPQSRLHCNWMLMISVK